MNLRRPSSAFTLIELITVIAIIALVAGIALPVLTHFRKGDAMLAATRQMLDAVGRARQLAISQHTTVYMVFVPPEFWNDSINANAAAYNSLGTLAPSELRRATNVLDKQMTGYVFLSLRSIGDQPGRNTPRFLSSWQALPESSFIPSWKFTDPVTRIYDPTAPATVLFTVNRFNYRRDLPFPSEDAAYAGLGNYVWLPYISFDYLGRLVSEKDSADNFHDAYIPLAHGSVFYAKDPLTRQLQLSPPSAQESPAGNSTNISFNLIHIDWLTGRARLERFETR